MHSPFCLKIVSVLVHQQVFFGVICSVTRARVCLCGYHKHPSEHVQGAWITNKGSSSGIHVLACIL
jgi:hypothetical protein